MLHNASGHRVHPGDSGTVQLDWRWQRRDMAGNEKHPSETCAAREATTACQPASVCVSAYLYGAPPSHSEPAYWKRNQCRERSRMTFGVTARAPRADARGGRAAACRCWLEPHLRGLHLAALATRVVGRSAPRAAAPLQPPSSSPLVVRLESAAKNAAASKQTCRRGVTRAGRVRGNGWRDRSWGRVSDTMRARVPFIKHTAHASAAPRRASG